jgi:hypothetical protein
MSAGARAAAVFSAMGLAALLAAALLPRHGEAEENHEESSSTEEVIVEWDMEAAVERARREEASRLTRQNSDNRFEELHRRMTAAVISLQPWYEKRPRLARRLAGIILDAARDHEQEPWIALSMAYKESSLSPGVGRLQVTGELGEEGYFQIMPRSFPMRECGKGRSMGNARANADTAMCWLSYVRNLCETDDPWQYVSAYGMSRCPEPGEGRELRPSKRGREILCRMVGEEECDSIWPSADAERSATARARAVHPSPVAVAGLEAP